MRLLSIESISCKSMMLAERNHYLTFDESDLSVRTELKYNTESPTDIPVIVPQQRSTKDWGVAKGYSTWLVLSVRCDIGSTLESGP